MKPLVIYHGNCVDGFSAAWVFHHYNPEGYDFHIGVYGQQPPDVRGRRVYLVDFSYPKNVVERMVTLATKVTLIDHHKTAIESLNSCRDLDMFVDLNMSGATLAWKYLFGDYCPRPTMLGHIEDRDLWKFKLPLTEEVSAAIFSTPYTFENWDNLMSMSSNEIVAFAVGGSAIMRKQTKDIRELLIVTKRYLEIDGQSVPVASLPYTLSSEAGHLMCHQEVDATYFEGNPANVWAACYWDTVTHRIFSCRSLDDGADVSAIALKFGGGGHKHAAGFQVPRDHILAKS